MMHITKNISKDIEKENLEAHVELCIQRYIGLEKRVESLEADIDKLKHAADSSKSFIMTAVGVATAVISTVVSLTVIILDKFK
jgi:cob(I)alamin adenosyltransferase